MKKVKKFSPGVRERAVRMVQEHRVDFSGIYRPKNLWALRSAPLRRPIVITS